MATRKLIVLTISIAASLFISRTKADADMEASASVTNSSAILPPSSPPSTSPSQEFQDRLNPTAMLEPILTNFGFQELAMAIPSLSDSAYTSWNGPLTIFAPTDTSIQSCGDSCSVPQLLREHIVPGIFSIEYLRKLAFGTKIETMNPGQCITVTSAYNKSSDTKTIFIGGVEITYPDLFYNGLFVVHRLEGFISHLSPFSCNVERMSSLSFPNQPSFSDHSTQSLSSSSPVIMHLMLKDAMLRLHNNGFSIVSLALRVKYPELVNLHNMTVFALEDSSIFSGGHTYLSNFRFHIVPNRLLMNADLVKLPVGTTLATLDRGQKLVVTTAGGRGAQRINYMRIKNPDVMYNLKIVVHSVFLPFPHLQPAVAEYGDIGGSRYDTANVIGNGETFQTRDGGETVIGTMESCAVSEKGGCAVAPTPENKATV